MAKEQRKYYPSRWSTLAASLMFLCITGIQYAFALISETLKDRLNLKQTQLDTIGVFGTIGANSGIFAGLFNNRFGPNISIWVGVVITCIGYSLLTAITTQFYPSKSAAFACFANFLFNHGTAWFSMIATPLSCIYFLSSLTQIFSKYNTKKPGKGYLGIGSAFISVFKSDLAHDNVDRFMVYTMIFIPIACMIFGWYIVQLPTNLAFNYLPNEIKYGKDKKCGLSILLWYIFSFTFAVFLVIIAILQTAYSFNIYVRITFFIITIILWLSPWVLAFCCHGDKTINYEKYCQQIESLKINESIDGKQEQQEELLNDNPLEINNDNYDNVGMPQIFTYWQLYCMYLINGIVAGSSVAYISNVSQIIESASSNAINDNENNGISTSLVAIISFGSFCGRVFAGILVDYFSDRFHCSMWLIMAPLIMTFTQFTLFFSNNNIGIITVCGYFIGISVGWIFSCVIVCVKTLWGTRWLSGNYSVFDSSAAFGGVIFATIIFGSIYDHFAKKEENDIHYYKGTKCYGDDCYKWTNLICGCCACFALILSIIHWKFTPKQKRN